MLRKIASGRVTVLLLVLLGASLIACSSSDSTKFATNAAQAGLAEVELGRLAVRLGSNPAVQSFGQKMIVDHSQANTELQTIAGKKKLELPRDVNANQRSTIDKLSKLSGAQFDKEYVADMVSDHEAAAKDFESQANKGNDAELKAFAAKTLPAIQRHLQMARDLSNQVKAN